MPKAEGVILIHMKQLFTLLFIWVALFANAQIVTIEPNNAGADDVATLIFDASMGNAELSGASQVYMHHGVITDSEDGTSWSYVIGNWGADDGVGEMTKVDGETDKWEITFSPSIREYFDVPESENIFRICGVFRSADGNTKGTTSNGTYSWGEVVDGDFFINLNVSNYVTFNEPSENQIYLNAGESITLDAIASNAASTISFSVDEGNGYTVVKTVQNVTEITYEYTPTITGTIGLKVDATIGGEEFSEEKSIQVILHTATNIEKLPDGIKAGINYDANDNTKVTLALEAPGKEFAYVVGDFTNWEVKDEYQMNQTPDGEYFWIELTGLTPQQKYVFQYWIDADVKVGDPYADLVADPWNDSYISDETFPDIPDYPYTDYGIATILETGQDEFVWSSNEDEWERPDINQLVIYELLVRDFLASHSYVDLIDTLSYLKNLGIDAVELMPVNEFEGNESWGYNPNYFFAVDKYYGTKDQLKEFVESAHEMGIAVIFDMVLNHAYGTCALVEMYWDDSASKPSADNPWFNQETVGQYGYGYDFNHESEYTQRFVDRVNQYWLEEFHFDGYRFDFTKGFTNYAPGGSVDGFDQSRIDILERMGDALWSFDPDAYIIFEHWGVTSEENVLGQYGFKMWKHNYSSFINAVNGECSNSFSGLSDTTHVIYYDSHDESRIAEEALNGGLSEGTYDIQNPVIMCERMKMAAAFNFLQPGPKMIWQFDELGYDIDIDYNGRVGNKPLPWGDGGLGYYEDEIRHYILEAYQAILKLRKEINPEKLLEASINNKQSGEARRYVFDTDSIDLVLIGNFGLTDETISPEYTEAGTWYDYFSGEEFDISNVAEEITLTAGEWHIYTSERMSNGFDGVVETFDSPVTISPSLFTMSDEITITFNASKAWKNKTDGLITADTVYMYAGLITEDPDSTTLENIVDNGMMTKLNDSTWQISIVPQNYFGLSEAYKLGMYFHDASGENVGMGFRNGIMYFDVTSVGVIVGIEPAAFNADDEITITFDARQGNQELVGADKVYIHSGVCLEDTDSPSGSSWQNTVGNWGTDDGIGEMTEVDDNIWQITLTPDNYYSLDNGEHPYWISCVFRNANGSAKGTASAGTFENGIINSDLDYFIKNQLKVGVKTVEESNIVLYPNPTTGLLNIKSLAGEITFYNSIGTIVLQQEISVNDNVDISSFERGLYIYKINSDSGITVGRVLKK